MNAALEQLEGEIGAPFEDSQVQLIFSIQCESKIPPKGPDEAPILDRVWLDVYCAAVEGALSIQSMKVDLADKIAIKYMALEELQQKYEAKDPSLVLPSNPAYSPRLFRSLWKIVRQHHAKKPKL